MVTLLLMHKRFKKLNSQLTFILRKADNYFVEKQSNKHIVILQIYVIFFVFIFIFPLL